MTWAEALLLTWVIGGVSFNGDMLFSFVEAHALKKHVASEEFKNAKVKYPEKKERIKELSDSLDDMDNPVLVMVRLKH